MTDELQRDPSELRRRRTTAARQLLGLVGIVAVYLYFNRSTYPRLRSTRIGKAWLDCFLLGSGLYMVYLVVLDVRSGVSRIGTYAMGDKYAYTRDSDPVVYWVMIAFHAAIAVGMILASVGELLGVWKI